MIMKLAIDKARDTMMKDYGGPFGAVIVKDDKILIKASNSLNFKEIVDAIKGEI